MGTKRHKPEEIVTKLRQVNVLVGQLGNSSTGEGRSNNSAWVQSASDASRCESLVRAPTFRKCP